MFQWIKRRKKSQPDKRVGWVDEITEDERGIWVTGTIHDDEAKRIIQRPFND